MNYSELQALVTKWREKIAKLESRQMECLAGADKDDATDEDKKKLLDEFDKIEAVKATERENLKRAEDLIAKHLEPAQAAIVLTNATTEFTAGRTANSIPNRQLRGRALKAFKGDDAELNAYRAGLWVAGVFYGNEWARSQWAAHGLTAHRADGSNGGILATMSTIDNRLGGYFVPDVMDNAIMWLTELYGVFRRLADHVTMTSDTWSGPRWTNAMTVYWVGEGSAPSQSEPGFDRVMLVAKNLAAYGKMTRQLSEDSMINMGDVWTRAAAIAFSKAEDDAGFNGDGTSTYGGIQGLLTLLRAAANSASVVTATGHASLATLTLGDFWSVIGKFPNYPGADPRWFVNKEVYAATMGPLQTAAGGVTEQGIKNTGFNNPGFLGYPVEFVNVMPRVASFASAYTGILFGDLALSSKFGDRRQRTMEVGMINDDLIKQLMTMFAASRLDIVNHTIVDPLDSTAAGPMLALKLG